MDKSTLSSTSKAAKAIHAYGQQCGDSKHHMPALTLSEVPANLGHTAPVSGMMDTDVQSRAASTAGGLPALTRELGPAPTDGVQSGKTSESGSVLASFLADALDYNYY